jgi:hypothetical protein
MDKDSPLVYMQHEAENRLKWILSILIDSLFLVLWVFLAWSIDKVVAFLPIAGIEQWILTAFRTIFDLSTLAAVLLYYYQDIAVMYFKAQKRVHSEGRS